MVECYAITIRNGEALQDSKQEGLNKEDVKGTPTKPPKEEIVINAIQCPEEEDKEWCMRMDVIEGLNREVQQEEAMQEFEAKQGRCLVLIKKGGSMEKNGAPAAKNYSIDDKGLERCITGR
ncbi:hypothetical protein PIB30_063338 [Stylosanthes scabra]|uniref:Uncharacterized protein n=1 Tax=Stylosanthes scabra TaxID=79078 RepID=A0ABU6WL97_9FABA|nr:hypothetical protein [Stylosanthes scabra]